MEDNAKKWLTNKVMRDIIGCCCEISNLCGHKYPFDKTRWNENYIGKSTPTYGEMINNNLDKIVMLLVNFSEYVNHKTVIDDYFNEDKKLPRDKQNHWSSEEHIRDFKCFVKEALVKARDSKLEMIIDEKGL